MIIKSSERLCSELFYVENYLHLVFQVMQLHINQFTLKTFFILPFDTLVKEKDAEFPHRQTPILL